MGNKPNQREPLLFSVLHDPFEQSQRLVLIELAFAQVCISPAAQFELAIPAGADQIDSG